MKTIRLSITGNVQGVFYRAHAEKKAKELGLCGYVCNESDGSVTLVIQGNDEELSQFTSWCHEGSPASSVESVSVEEMKTEEVFEDFSIRS